MKQNLRFVKHYASEYVYGEWKFIFFSCDQAHFPKFTKDTSLGSLPSTCVLIFYIFLSFQLIPLKEQDQQLPFSKYTDVTNLQLK